MFSVIVAQNNTGAIPLTLSQTIKIKVPGDGTSKLAYNIQVGLPILGRIQSPLSRNISPADVRFPWDILYLQQTFSNNYFDVSKGYYGDKIKIEWELRNNLTGTAAVTGLRVFRRLYNPSTNADWGNPISNLAANATFYEDKYVEGGVLYEYKVYAVGVYDKEVEFRNFITGIGFRSPTAIVTGNISFKGGNPVKDVVVQATSKGGAGNVLKALSISNTDSVSIVGINKPITNVMTLQAWLKPTAAYTNDVGNAIRLFNIKSDRDIAKQIPVTVKLKATSKILEINIGGSIYQLNNYYPSGNTNARGDDELVPVTSFNNKFVHFSVILNDGRVPTLFINGRPISQVYATATHTKLLDSKDSTYTAPYFSVVIPTATNSLQLSGLNPTWDKIYIGSGNSALVDEIRIWNKAIDTSTIRTDFKRYISGNHPNLVTNLSANEGVGFYAYDMSRNGFSYNKNNGLLSAGVIWVNGAGNTPTSDQLGVLGVTDEKGNYEITAIPYSGTGESFTITPMYGQHKFEASQQLVFLGQGSEVANKIDFIDKSSFSFKGIVMYDSRGVFPSFVDVNRLKTPATPFATLSDGDEFVSGPGISDVGYNYYQKGDYKYNKGEYWMKNNGTVASPDYYLERYARIYVEGANVYVDGQIVLDANNLPVITDKEGYFDVSVPIGNHAITIKKDGHGFIYGARFPAEPGTYKEFFENSNEPVIFVDTTRVTAVGKVVGGAVEAAKKIGFGGNGFVTRSLTDTAGISKTIEVSAKNNIGMAQFVLGYKPNGAAAQPTTTTTFKTNKYSGEYRVDLLPLEYELTADNLTIISNTDSVKLLKAGITETLNFSKVGAQIIPEFSYKSANTLDSIYLKGNPYHYEKSFIYRSTPILQVTKQTSDETIRAGGVDYPTTDFIMPIYTQFNTYKINLKRFESYINKDSLRIVSNVPVSDGQLIATNNLALPNSESLNIDSSDASILIYSFRGGIPSVVYPFNKTISLKFRINDQDYAVVGLKDKGIILGGAADNSQTFVTEAPEFPAIILRDPPGTNSHTSIEKGTSLSFTTEASVAHTEGTTDDITICSGLYFELAGGMVPTPATATEVFNNIKVGIGINNTSNNGKSVTSTYTFNKTISTSDQPDYNGSDGDLYIGNSKNIFYGSYDNIEADLTVPRKYENGVYRNLVDGEYLNVGTLSNPIYISKQKALSFVDKPTETFFVYSQKHILSTLIPEYETFIASLLNGPNPDSPANVNKIKQYQEKIRLWKKVIFDNEKSKFIAKHYRSIYKNNLNNIVDIFNASLKNSYEEQSTYDPVIKSQLKNKLNDSKALKDLLNANFEKNISFDAGVGEYSQSVETNIVKASSYSYNLVLDQNISSEIKNLFNKVGVILNLGLAFQQDISTALTQENTETTNISYFLKDNDPGNYLSVDVVNPFDGNGPIFSTQGGRSSCPYEGAETSKFFPESMFKLYFSASKAKTDSLNKIERALVVNDSLYNVNRNNYSISQKAQNRNDRSVLIQQKNLITASINKLDSTFEHSFDNYLDDDKAPLGFATQRVEVPLMSVTDNNKTNIADGKNAEFELKLSNNSAAGQDADFKLIVDNTTNPNNALINIEPNGTIVHVPFGQTVIYKMTLGKSISDVYEYNNIKVRLESLCDGEDVCDSVRVSAKFVPSCSEVSISAPLTNWVYNREKAYNPDKTTKPLLINLTGFNSSFAGFQKIDLEYRSVNEPNWTRLQTYYSTQNYLDQATEADKKVLIGANTTLSHSFNMANPILLDGYYEIRARSSCVNGTGFISEVSKGKVDLNAPVKFGTPTPTDGILGPGEDLKVSFNEPVSYNTATSLIEIKGQTNQLQIDHNVSLYFQGANNTAIINNPKIVTGDFTLECWMKNYVGNIGVILNQNGGIKINLNNDQIQFKIGGIIVDGIIPTDEIFHHYTFTHKNSTGEVYIFMDDKVIGSVTGTANVQFGNNEPLVIGGNTFNGNIHDLRIWNKTISLTDAYAKMYVKLSGNEAGLVGYWPMDEGRGIIANDKSRYKHAELKASWDIKPKGTSYSFSNGQYLLLDNVTYAQLTNEMDATISFWLKTPTAQEATIFSNGKGDGTDINQPDGLDNKWAINMNSTGNLTFNSEGRQYTLTNKSLADDAWHHVSLLFNRQGALKTYIDAVAVTSNNMTNIGGFSGNKIWLGARGATDLAGVVTIDRNFNGKIDEFQLWNTLRNEEQIFRDRYFEVDAESIGLLLYARMNQPDPANNNGPKYYHAYSSNTVISSNAKLNIGTVNYAEDAPPIKPERTLISFKVNRVLNGSDMIIEPEVTDIASLEGQVLDITVHRMYDASNNEQESPITWTAYYRRNEVSWFAEGYNDIVDIVKAAGAIKSFEITLLNKGGKTHPFTISNLPKWLSLSQTTGTIAPDSKIIIVATIDKDYANGEYIENLNLQTDFGYDEKMQVKLRVLAKDPNWSVNPADFDKSMTIVGRIKVDEIFSEDAYDQIAAFSNDTVVGVAKLVYNAAYKQYYTFLSVYSNGASGKPLTFKIWNAAQGKILGASIDGRLTINFQDNDIIGSLSNPIIFANSNLIEQNIALNKGWSWISMNVNDPNFINLNQLTKNLQLATNDRIINGVDQEVYSKNVNPATWSGTINRLGLSASKMYKVFMAHAQTLTIKGTAVDIANYTFPVNVNWNWFPFPLPGNRLTSESLAYLDASDGDVIKSQNLFAIFDPKLGWTGTLKYLEPGKGYMLKSAKAQSFKFPTYLVNNLGINQPVLGTWNDNKIKNFSVNTVQSSAVGEPIGVIQTALKEEFKQYSQNMNAVVLMPDGYNELTVYDETGTLKGIASREKNSELSFITIYGDKSQLLSFYIGDGFNRKKTTNSFGFIGNEVLGTISKPVILGLPSENMRNYPNPFANDFIIELNAEKSQNASIRIYTVTGQLVFDKLQPVEIGKNKIKIIPNIPDGTYLLQIQMNGQTVLNKMFKQSVLN